MLQEYVAQSGRLVMDFPGCWYDTNGRLLPTGVGSEFTALVGVSLDDFQYSNNRPRQIRDLGLNGWCADLTLHGGCHRAGHLRQRGPSDYRISQWARNRRYFRLGRVVIVFFTGEPENRRTGEPEKSAHQELLITHALGTLKPEFSADTICYALPSPQADH